MTQLANFRPNKAGGPHYLIGVANENTPKKDVHNFGIAFFSPVPILITFGLFHSWWKKAFLKTVTQYVGERESNVFQGYNLSNIWVNDSDKN